MVAFNPPPNPLPSQTKPFPRVLLPGTPSLQPLWLRLRRLSIQPTPHLLLVEIPRQRLLWLQLEKTLSSPIPTRLYRVQAIWPVSTSRYGIGQRLHSRKTPLGLHRIASIHGRGWPCGIVLQARRPTGYTWQQRPDAPILHRALWLEGLEPGWNQGGKVDSYTRMIYLHGTSQESKLGRPASIGCIHLASQPILTLADALPPGTLVWITSQKISLPPPNLESPASPQRFSLAKATK